MVPLCDEQGSPLALLSVAGSRSGLRLTPTELEVLATIADHTAIALTQAADGSQRDRPDIARG